MALQLDMVTQTGISVTGVYCQIENLTIAKDGSMSFSLARYVQRGTEFPPILTTSYATTYDRTGKDAFQQSYDYLKTLDEFKTAVDVLEEGQPL